MKRPRSRAVVLNASVNAIRPERGFLDYNVSKAGVVSIAEFHLAVNASQRVRRQGWLAGDRSRGDGEGGWPSRRLPESG
jgi:hypothetical protein